MFLQNLKRTFKFIHQHPFAKQHLLHAYFQFAVWQIQSRNSTKFHVKNFIEGIKFYAKKGLTGITGNIYTGLHEFDDMGFLLHFLRKEDTFFDIGANVGSYTLLAAGVVGCRTVSFEPSPITYEILTKNIQLNHLESLAHVHNAAIGSTNGHLFFTENEDTTNHVILQTEDFEAYKKVPVKTLDEFHEFAPSILKIDVEGFETEVLLGGRLILSDPKLKAIIIELNGSGLRYGFDEDKIHEMLLEHQFLPYTYHPLTRELILLSSYSEFNTIYIKDVTFVQQRLSEAKGFKLWNEII